MKTYQFRIKDSSQKVYLCSLASKVNLIWNYCNQAHFDVLRNRSKWLTWVDLNKLTSGSSRLLNLHSDSINAVCEEYASRVKKAKRRKISWRSKKRNLGWIPFKSRAIKLENDRFKFNGKWFKFFKSREIIGTLKVGSICQDSKGNWFVNFTCEVQNKSLPETKRNVGIDLGLKTQLTLSNGKEYKRENLTKKYEEKLSKAQRANKKKQVTNLHAKIKNVRKDWNHKVTTEIIKENDTIIIGNVSSRKLVKTRFAKSVNDASWGTLKLMLGYKAVSLGRSFQVVDERFSTITCSSCSARSGPSGLSGLGVRNWKCFDCGSLHVRDVNSAVNILNSGLGHETLIKGIPVL